MVLDLTVLLPPSTTFLLPLVRIQFFSLGGTGISARSMEIVVCGGAATAFAFFLFLLVYFPTSSSSSFSVLTFFFVVFVECQ